MKDFSSLRDFTKGFDALLRDWDTPRNHAPSWYWETTTTTNDYVGEDKGDRLELSVDLPGVKKEDVKVSFEKKVLTIKAERGERKYNKSYRIVAAEVQSDKVTAKLEDGVLTVTMPKPEGSKPTDIPVE